MPLSGKDIFSVIESGLASAATGGQSIRDRAAMDLEREQDAAAKAKGENDLRIKQLQLMHKAASDALANIPQGDQRRALAESTFTELDDKLRELTGVSTQGISPTAIQPSAANRETKKDANGFLRYTDTGERVFTGVQKTEEPPTPSNTFIDLVNPSTNEKRTIRTSDQSIDTLVKQGWVKDGAAEKGTAAVAMSPEGIERRVVFDGQKHVFEVGGEPVPGGWQVFKRGVSAGNLGDAGVGGLSGNDVSKLVKERGELEGVVLSVVEDLETLKKIKTSKNYIGGTAGDAVEILNGLRAQTQQIVGSAPLYKEGNINDDVFEPDVNFSRFRDAALKADVEEGMVLDLAYSLAKSKDPGGRISDKDLSNAIGMLSKSADPQIAVRTINSLQNRLVQRFNINQRISRRNSGVGEDKLPDIKLDRDKGKQDEIDGLFKTLLEPED